MPIFEYDGKKRKVSDEQMDAFAQKHPDAITIAADKNNKKYQVRASNYGKFKADNATTPAPAAPEQTDWKPSQQNKREFAATMQGVDNSINNTAAFATEQADNMREYGANLGLTTKQGKPRFNAENGKLEDTYITPAGNRYNDKTAAEFEGAKFRHAADMSVGRQLRDERLKLQELKDEHSRRAAEIDKEWEDDYSENGAPLATILASNTYVPRQKGDGENSAYTAAIRQSEERIRILEDQQDRDNGIDVGFWRGFGQVMGDMRTWDMGTGDMSDAVTMLNADKLIGEGATDGEKKAHNEMLAAVQRNQQAEQQYGKNASFWNRAGVTTGYMPSFALEFTLTRGGFDGMNVFGKLGSKLATKAVGKKAIGEIAEQGFKSYVKNNGIKGFGRAAADWTIKAMGTSADDLLLRAPLMTNTIQLGKTSADVIDRKLGDVVTNVDGNYTFSNEKTWGDAVWQGEANSIIENYSEMFGGHLDPVMSLSNMSKLANTLGAKRLGDVLAKADAGALKGIMGATDKMFKKMGVSDYFGEVTEEYYGQLWRTMLNLDDAYQQNIDGSRTNLFKTGQFHGDIWGGMALSMGMMGVGKQSINAASYTSMKHGVNKADARANELLGADTWEPIKTIFDLTTNEDIGGIAETIISDKDFSNEEKIAVLDYMERSIALRGFNLASLANSRDGEHDEVEQQANESYLNGYNATSSQEMVDAKNMYDYQREQMKSVLGISDVLLEDGAIDWIFAAHSEDAGSEQQQVILDYLNAKQVHDGMMQRVSDDIDSRIEQSNAMVSARANKDNGEIQPATMKQDDRKVYIVKGNVVPYADKSGIDISNSDNSIIVRDAETGEMEQISPDALLSIDEPQNASEQQEIAAQTIREQFEQDAANKINGTISAYNVGDTYAITTEDGSQVQVQIVANEAGVTDNGDGTVNVSDGNQVFPISKEVIQQSVDAANLARIAEFEKQRVGEQQATTPNSRPQYAFNDELVLQDANGNMLHGEITADADGDGRYQVYTDNLINGQQVNLFTADELDAMLKEHNGVAVGNVAEESDDNILIDKARAGDAEAIEKLNSYGLSYNHIGVYRHVGQSEVNGLLNDGAIKGRRGEQGIDVTSSEEPTTAYTSDYRVKYKNFDLDKNESEQNRVVLKNDELGDGWITDGQYSLDDVERIDKRNPDGSYTQVYPPQTVSKQTPNNESAPKYPTKKSGELDYDKFTRQQLFDYTAETEGQDVAISDLEEDIKDAETQIKKAEDSVKRSRGANKVKAREKLKSLGEELSSLKDMMRVTFPTKAEFDNVKESTVIDEHSDLTPQTGLELAAQFLQGQKLLYADYKRETGYGDSEAKKMMGQFASKENGGVSIERAGELLELYDNENGTTFFTTKGAFQGDMYDSEINAGRSAIIEILTTVRTRGELFNYIKEQRVKQQAEYDYALQQEFEAALGESIEDHEAYLEVMELEAQDFIENYEEINAIFVEESIKQQELENYERENNNGYDSRENIQPNERTEGTDIQGELSESETNGEISQQSQVSELGTGDSTGERQSTPESDAGGSLRLGNGTVAQGERSELANSADATESGSEQRGEIETHSTPQKNKGINIFDPRSITDEERQRRGSMLQNAQVVIVEENQIASSETVTARQAAEKWWDEHVSEPVFYSTEAGEVEINKNSVENSLAHRYGQRKLDAITSLVGGFENAVYLGTMPDSRERGVVDHYFAYPISYNGVLNYVFCRAMQDANKNRLYVHEVFVADNIKKGDALQTAASKPHGGISLYRDILANVLSVGKDSNNQSNNNNPSEKSLENQKDANKNTSGYSITPSQYTTQRGKVLDMQLVKFDRELTKEEQRNARELAKGLKGWYDRKQGGFLMRSAEDAQQIVDAIMDESGESLEDAAPLSLSDIQKVTSEDAAPKRVDIEGVINDLSSTGEAKLSDHEENLFQKAERIAKEQAEPKNEGVLGLVSDERMEELKEKLRKKMGGQLNVGIDPEILAIGMELAAGHIDRGVKRFADFARVMIADLGDAIRPYLKAFYNGARDLPEIIDNGLSEELTPYDEVRGFDVANFDKERADILAQAEVTANELAIESQTESTKKEITNKRNTERRKENEQTTADTQAIASKAESIASKAESDIETATTEQQVNPIIEVIDEQLESINKQLALLGYYKADEVDAEFHETYGYMRSAEKKALADANALAEQLVKDLGIDRSKIVDKKGKKIRKIASANIAPIGGDITITLPLIDDKVLYFNIGLSKVVRKDDLEVTFIMSRIEKIKPTGGRESGTNTYHNIDATYERLLRSTKSLISTAIPAFELPANTPAASKNTTNKRKTNKKTVTSQTKVADLFSELANNTNIESNEITNNRDEAMVSEQSDSPNVGNNEARTNGRVQPSRTRESITEQYAKTSAERGVNPDVRTSGNVENGGHERVGDKRPQPKRPTGEIHGTGTDAQHRRDSRKINEQSGTDGRGEGIPEGKSSTSVDRRPVKPVAKKQFTNNYAYPDNASEIDNYTKAQRLSVNVKALDVLRNILLEARQSTAEEREILGRFRGWGGIDLGRSYSIDMMKRERNEDIRKLAEIIESLDPKGEKGILAAINRAALSSYYTPTPIARAINSFVQLSGFKGGNLLDPSMGSGIFEGTMPIDIQQRTAISGVELDWLTGQIAKQLYPDADVRINGFESSNIAPNSYDVVESNIPFGDFGVSDSSWKGNITPIRKAAQSRIHNYFAVKMIESTKKGGLCTIMTSNAILDTRGNQIIRDYIASQCEILGVVRLPDNTFKGAGTSVVTDVIFLRKYRDESDSIETRSNGKYLEDIETPFLHSAASELFNKSEGRSYSVEYNAYFSRNPQMVVGEQIAGGQYRRDQYGLTSDLTTDEIGEKLNSLIENEVIGKRKGKIFNTTATSREVYKSVRESYVGDGDYISNGNIIEQNGKYGVLEAEKGKYGETTRTFTEVPRLNSKGDRIKAMLPIRKAMKQLISEQIAGADDSKLRTIREELKRTYEAYTKEFGKLGDKSNDYLDADIDGYTIRSLEKWKEGKFIGLSDIFTKNTIKPSLDITQAKTPAEVISVSLSEYGEIRVSFMEDTLGEDWQEQCGDSIFKTPFGSNSFETRDSYLSGDVKTKLDEARIAAATDKSFNRNVKALEDVQPEDIEFSDINIRMGARWVPADVYTDFLREIYGIRGWNRKSGIAYSPEADEFAINIISSELGGKAEEWKTERRSASDVFEAALKDKSLVVYDVVETEDSEVKVVNKEQTELVNGKIQDLRSAFEDWLAQDGKRVEVLTSLYNDMFNRTVLRKFDGSHLNISGLMGMELRPHQKDAVWMLVNNRGGIVDHIVGAGKTLVMQSAIMEMRRMGIAKKPMIVALKSTVAQIAKEFNEAYPAARILAPTEKDFEKTNRKKFLSNIALNDYDCVILSHDQYKMLPHSEEVETSVINEQLAQLDNAIEFLYGQSDRSSLTKKQIKGLEKRKANLEAKLASLLDRKVDREFTFENLGVDYLFVDECQAFKSLPYVTSYQNVAGLGSAKGSQGAIALLNGIRYLQKLHQGDRGTVFLSGTTITNSLVEIYNLMQYLRPREMERLNLKTFDAWASQFAVRSYELEYGVTNELKEKNRFRNFDNVPELAKMYAEIADVRNDLNLTLPKPKGNMHIVTVPTSDSLSEINQEVINMVNLKDGSYFGFNTNARSPFGLLASTTSAKAAISTKLIFPELDDNDGKIKYVCENIKKIYDKFSAQKGTQLIFCDTGVPVKGKPYDAYTDIIDRLTNEYGIPRDQIADIHIANNDQKRKALFAKVNDGQIRILIGGTKNMGTGVNVQKRITAMHHIDVPWTPADREQREGRGVRQGNEIARDFNNNNVDIYFYATEGSLDMYKYQLQDTKGKMFAQFKQGTVGERNFDEGNGDEEGGFDPAEIVALLSGNPVIFDKSKQDKLVEKLRRAKRAYESDWRRRKAKFESLKESKSKYEQLIRLNERDKSVLERGGFTPNEAGTYPSEVTVSIFSNNGVRESRTAFDKPKEAGAYIHKQLSKGKKVELSGFGMTASIGISEDNKGLFSGRVIELNAPSGIKYTSSLSEDDTAAGLSFRNVLMKVINNSDVYKKGLDDVNRQLEGADPKESIFPKQEQLDKAIEKKKKLDAEYKKLSADGDKKKDDDILLRDGELDDSDFTPEEQEIIDKAGDNAFKAPNGKPTKLTPKQWAQVRTKAFIEWFGDWLKAARIEKLRNSKPIIVSSKDYQGKYELNRSSAKSWLKDNVRGTYINKDTNQKVEASKIGIDKITSHGERDDAHLKSLSVIPQLIENSIFIEERPNTKGNGKYDTYQYYVVGINIDGVDYTAKIVFGVKGDVKYYDHNLIEIEKGALIDNLNVITKHVADNQNSLNKDKDSVLFSLLQTNSSKVVDENGEPLVVYHGSSSNNIREFDKTQSTREPSSLKEFGYFFTTNKDVAEMYANIPMRKELIDEIDAEIAKLREEQAETRNNRDYYAFEDTIDMLEAQKNGRVYETFLNIRDMYEVDAEGKTFYEGRQNIRVPLSYKTATGIDAIEALAGENSMDKSVKVDGVKMSNVIEMSIGSDNPELLERYFAKYGGDSYQVFGANNIKSAIGNSTFSTKNNDIYLREEQTNKEVNDRFNEELDKQISGKLSKGHIYNMGMPTDVLLAAGFDNFPIELAASRLNGKSMQDNHPFELSEVKDLPLAIQNPIAVFTSATRLGSKVIFTEIEHKGKNFVVAVETDRKSGRISVNSIRSVYPKGNVSVASWINDGLLDYIDKEKISKWISKQRSNSADVRKTFRDATKIVESFVNPTLSNDKNVEERISSPTRTTPSRADIRAMEAHVKGLCERLNLDNVEVLTSTNGLEGKRRKAKGFYEKSTGKIVVVVPNNSSIEDVEQTILHEAVAHYGLRRLFGSHFYEFLDKVFANVDETVRKRIVDLAVKNGWDFRKATEEYLGTLAETTNFENAKNEGWWSNVKSFFADMLKGLGFTGTITDNELRYVLWKSYDNLKSGGKTDIFSEAADVAMQSSLEVGEYGADDTLFRDGEVSPQARERAYARRNYEDRVTTGWYQSQEALQDSMLGLKEAMTAILGKKWKDVELVEDFENAYLGENRLSSSSNGIIKYY